MTSKTNDGRIILFILALVITVTSIGFMPVHAQYTGGPYNPNANTTSGNTDTGSTSTGDITLKTDLSTYNQGDTIIVSGKVSASAPYSAVTLRMLDSHDNLIFIGQLLPASDGSFTKTFAATGQYWKDAGTYTVEYQYGAAGTLFKQTLYYNGGDGSASVTKVTNETSYPQSGNPNPACNDCNQTSTTIQPTPTPIPTITSPPTPVVSKIPAWVKGIFNYYGQGQVSDDELLGAIKFLVNQGIIKLD